jgi:hypothetical protein
MRYLTEADAVKHRVNLDCANIHKSGSVVGMRERYGWPKGGQIRVGSYIYNIGVREVERLQPFIRGR